MYGEGLEHDVVLHDVARHAAEEGLPLGHRLAIQVHLAAQASYTSNLLR